MKKCNECGETKALTEFYKRTAAADGLQACCKSCSCAKSLLVVLGKRDIKAVAKAAKIAAKLTGKL